MQKLTVIFACLLIFAPSCDSTHHNLNSINDLKDVDFGQSVSKHSLLLLHWFANVINIDNNHILHLSFDQNTAFGSHHYGNYEGVLEPLPRGSRYYTVGNLNAFRSRELPDYVLHPAVREYVGNNMDRIVFRVQETNSGVHRIDRVYLTQHYRPQEHQGTRYNPDFTYQISINLLQQIRMFSVQDNHRSLQTLRDQFGSNAHLSDIRNIWGASLASLGLLLFIVIQEKHSKIIRHVHKESHSIKPAAGHGAGASTKPLPTPEKVFREKPTKNRQPSTARRNPQPDFVVNIPEECNINLLYADQPDQVNLKIITGKNGKATIVWSNVSGHMIKEGVAVVLFKHQWEQEVSSTYKLIESSEGRYDTSVLLNDGLQVRLHKARRKCFFWTKVEEEICRGPELKSPGEVSILGNNAYLQLLVRDGKACARLYVRKSFRQWKSEFDKCWVGFYKSAERHTNDYEFWRWQWATKFQPSLDVGEFNTFEYCSGMRVAPGVQARFIHKNSKELARTPTWQ